MPEASSYALTDEGRVATDKTQQTVMERTKVES